MDFQAATVLSGTYTISIGTTSASLGADDPIAMTNTQTFFSGHLGGLIGSSFTISGTSYSYNPSAGNLVVDIVSSDQPNVANNFGIGYLDSDETGTSTTRAFQFTGHGSFHDDFGLVTGFGVAAGGGGGVSAVPLPATFPMFGVAILGLGAVGYGMGRRRNAPATRTASNLG